MSISFGKTVTARDRKICLQVKCPDMPEGCVVSCTSVLESGKEVPSWIGASKGAEGIVVVVSRLNVPQTVTVAVINSQGREVESATKTIKLNPTRVVSEIAKRTGNDAALAMCKSVKQLGLPKMSLKMTSAMNFGNGLTLIRGTVGLDATTPDLISGGISVDILNADGDSMTAGPFVTVGDSVHSDRPHIGKHHRSIQFSVKIPKPKGPIIIWAKMEGPIPLAMFTVVTKETVQKKLKEYDAGTASAERQRGYDKWFRNVWRATENDLAVQRATRFEIEPKFSFIVPLYKTPEDFFRDMADSVLAQTYGNFELVLVNASPEDKRLAEVVREYVEGDERVRAIDLQENFGITENTNEGIKAATGEFLCFLDHDDTVEPDILYQYVRGINEYPDTDLLYCDEDKLQENGKYSGPFFKPDWNINLLRSMNYVCHMLTVRKSIIDSMPLPTRVYDGAQDHNMTFLVGERARNVYHARQVLYHWRVHPGSTSTGSAQKSYASDAGIRSVQEHLDRCGVIGKVHQQPFCPTMYRTEYEFAEEPLVSIIIPNKDASRMLNDCIRSIEDKSTYGNYEIVVVENNSTEAETFEYYENIQKNDERVRVASASLMESFNFSKIINCGCQNARGDYFIMLNNDTEVITANWIESMLGSCVQEDVGAVGAMLLYPDDTIQHGGVSLHLTAPCHIGLHLPATSLEHYSMLQNAQNVTAVTGACLMTRRDVFEQLGGLDETLEVSYNDIDYCLRLQHDLGKLVVYEPQAKLHHFESISRGRRRTDKESERFVREQAEIMRRYPKYYATGDPYMSLFFMLGGVYRHQNRK